MKIIINDIEFTVVENADSWKLTAKHSKTDTSFVFSKRDFPTLDSVKSYLRDE